MKVVSKATSLLTNLCHCTDHRRDSTKSTQSLSIDKTRNCCSSLELRARSYDGSIERPGTSCERFDNLIQMTEIEVPSRQQDRWQQIDRMKSKSACTICDYLVPTSSTSRENKYFGTITCPHQKKRENHLNIDVHSAGCSIVNTPNPLEKQGQRFDFHLPTPQSPRFLNLPTPPRSRLSSPSHFTEHKKFGFPPISDDSQSLPEIEVRQIDREELHLPQICNLSIGESHQNLRGVHLRGNRRHSLAPLQQNGYYGSF